MISQLIYFFSYDSETLCNAIFGQNVRECRGSCQHQACLACLCAKNIEWTVQQPLHLWWKRTGACPDFVRNRCHQRLRFEQLPQAPRDMLSLFHVGWLRGCSNNGLVKGNVIKMFPYNRQHHERIEIWAVIDMNHRLHSTVTHRAVWEHL